MCGPPRKAFVWGILILIYREPTYTPPGPPWEILQTGVTAKLDVLATEIRLFAINPSVRVGMVAGQSLVLSNIEQFSS